MNDPATARSDLPTGTVTLVFTDIEGSTKLLHELGAEAYADALAEHRRLLREAFDATRRRRGRHAGRRVLLRVPRRARGGRRGRRRAARRSAAARSTSGSGCTPGRRTSGPRATSARTCIWARRIGAAGHGGQVLLSEATHSSAGSPTKLSSTSASTA